ncbi:FUSC family protein [Streptomyces tibetensis]|uniref:FUSC family protein n=1 Tax=Streptomyces tibetensis TaxID=2382123 RepID=UPI0033F8E4CD
MTSAADSRPDRPRRPSRPWGPRSVLGRLPGSLPFAAAARGAVALALPLLVGLATGWVVLAAIAAIGALWGVSQDGSDPYRVRVRRLGWTGVSSALGLLAGEVALRSGEPAAVAGCLVAAALVAGGVGLRGRIASVSGMHLLLGVTIGSGIPVPGPWWQPPLALLAGVALVLVLSAAPWLWRRHHVERAAVLAVYRSAGEALRAAGTETAEEARLRMTLALNHAHEVMAPHLSPRGRRRRDETGELVRAFHYAVRLGEAVTAVVWEGRALPPALTRVPRHLAGRLLPGRLAAPEERAAPPAPVTGSPGTRALAELVTAVDGEPDGADLELRLPVHDGPGRAARVRYTLLLAGCVLAAHVLAEVLHRPRGYWLPMTVAFVYKPDFGPLFPRALHRCVGTIVGVAAIGAVSAAATGTYAVVGVVAVFGALMAIGVRHHYALATLGLTAVVFVLLDLLGDHRPLYGTRVVDTALASALVLVAHFAVWPDSAPHRAEAQTEAAVAAARRYRDAAPEAGPVQRQSLRRTAYHQLAEARRTVAHARREPARRGRPLPDWESAITAAEQLCDQVTAHAVAGTARPVR